MASYLLGDNRANTSSKGNLIPGTGTCSDHLLNWPVATSTTQSASQHHEQTTITWTRQPASAPMQNDEVTHWHQESSWRKIIPARLYRRLTNDRTKLFANSSQHHQRTNSSSSRVSQPPATSRDSRWEITFTSSSSLFYFSSSQWYCSNFL